MDSTRDCDRLEHALHLLGRTSSRTSKRFWVSRYRGRIYAMHADNVLELALYTPGGFRQVTPSSDRAHAIQAAAYWYVERGLVFDLEEILGQSQSRRTHDGHQ